MVPHRSGGPSLTDGALVFRCTLTLDLICEGDRRYLFVGNITVAACSANILSPHRPCENSLQDLTPTLLSTELIIRWADGVLRRCRNLCLSAMLETVRARAGKTIDIDVVNRVLLQPHWQNQVDLTDF